MALRPTMITGGAGDTVLFRWVGIPLSLCALAWTLLARFGGGGGRLDLTPDLPRAAALERIAASTWRECEMEPAEVVGRTLRLKCEPVLGAVSSGAEFKEFLLRWSIPRASSTFAADDQHLNLSLPGQKFAKTRGRRELQAIEVRMVFNVPEWTSTLPREPTGDRISFEYTASFSRERHTRVVGWDSVPSEDEALRRLMRETLLTGSSNVVLYFEDRNVSQLSGRAVRWLIESDAAWRQLMQRAIDWVADVD